MTQQNTTTDPRIGTADVNDWHIRPAHGNPGYRSGVWVIEAGDYADEGEPDLHIEITAKHSKDVAEFIVQAVRNEYARITAQAAPNGTQS